MAHKLFIDPQDTTAVLKKRLLGYKLPEVNGRIGVALYILGKEIFLGVSINPVLLETITRKRTIPVQKAKVRTFQFDITE